MIFRKPNLKNLPQVNKPSMKMKSNLKKITEISIKEKGQTSVGGMCLTNKEADKQTID